MNFLGNYLLRSGGQLSYIRDVDSFEDPRWMEFLGSTAPIPANMLAERVGTKTESHGLET